MIGEEGCAQCGGLGTIEVSRARSKRTADTLCKCVFLVLMGEIAALGRELAERQSLPAVPEPLDHRPVVAPELGHDGTERGSGLGGERLE